MTSTYTWLCDEWGCHWQASSEDRDEAHTWACEHSEAKRHATSLIVEDEP